jgi:hypothetical protein
MEIKEMVEKIWHIYPRKLGKDIAIKKIPKILKTISYEELTRSVERYKKDNQGTEKQFIMYGSTFFNGAYIDYLDQNYEPPDKPKINSGAYELLE